MVLMAAGVMFLSGGSTIARAGKDTYGNLSSWEATNLIEGNRNSISFVVLDVRTLKEYQEGHLPNAIVIDFRSPSFRDELDRLDRGKTYLVYCRTGNRSTSALTVMKELGFQKTFHLLGGITKWKEEGMRTEE
jgi:rhodanese-related sulfurtransferase